MPPPVSAPTCLISNRRVNGLLGREVSGTKVLIARSGFRADRRGVGLDLQVFGRYTQPMSEQINDTGPMPSETTEPLRRAIGERYLTYALSTIMHRALPDALWSTQKAESEDGSIDDSYRGWNFLHKTRKHNKTPFNCIQNARHLQRTWNVMMLYRMQTAF